ncbi:MULTISPECIES: tyrosine-protein phosphatase [Lentilactobacillus]|uniref:Tyrosine-protein phosphatase n=2 Tax=Lentilactobacillus TaxID=2767893 RepID=A0A0R1KSW1_9LACO|nr:MULTISPECIES: CpsB/CapC family capsule biosynthesis tyrosine phosphatase [Lentilactobacillus]KRK86646.1 protein-tyrosine-phosphatase [Lentilactobacillus sunkii DSM 19904]MCT3545312.1 tyrosine protein phosphatase [Lentilactobacillus buchneri]RRF98341.1 MAG: tyrosine protein phosphatase [Coriobacteriaceae bacterium]GEP25070.1 exopolysaccharide biosynthesis protein [Lentilactobacillus diolivorans]
MIDLHCHLLPGVDDGSKSMDISLKLANDAVRDGIDYALLTPHHMNGVYLNHKKAVIQQTQDFQVELDRHKIPLKVFPGQEVRINGDLLTALDQDDILFADEGGRYLMLEFPDDDVPSYTSNMIYELMQRGIIPIIVHPERNTKIMKQPDILYDLLNKGCLSQITAGSYVGTFGHKVQKFSKQLIQTGQANIFASDAHDLPNRKYEMNNAFKKLTHEYGVPYTKRFKNNAKNIINGDEVAINNINKLKGQFFWRYFK